MVVLDSTFVSDFVNRRRGALARYDQLDADGETIRVPAAVWVEVLHAFAPAKRAQVARLLEGRALFVDFTRELADEAARLQHELRREGTPLGWHDLQIATTALHFREALVSNDEAFDAVPGLARLDH
jgi:predicted nucleic acid-binding protein